MTLLQTTPQHNTPSCGFLGGEPHATRPHEVRQLRVVFRHPHIPNKTVSAGLGNDENEARIIVQNLEALCSDKTLWQAKDEKRLARFHLHAVSIFYRKKPARKRHSITQHPILGPLNLERIRSEFCTAFLGIGQTPEASMAWLQGRNVRRRRL